MKKLDFEYSNCKRKLSIIEIPTSLWKIRSGDKTSRFGEEVCKTSQIAQTRKLST